MRPLQTCRKIRTTRKTAQHGNKKHCPAILRQNKNEAATAPPRFHKKKEKNRTSCRFLQRNGTHPSTSRCPSFRPGRALWYSSSLLFPRRPLAFDGYIVHLFCRICKMRNCTTCYIYHNLFCIVCTIIHG